MSQETIDISIAGRSYPLTVSPEEVQGIGFIVSSVIYLVAGTVFMMWMGEQITEKGIGNGISLIIFINIINSVDYPIDIVH